MYSISPCKCENVMKQKLAFALELFLRSFCNFLNFASSDIEAGYTRGDVAASPNRLRAILTRFGQIYAKLSEFWVKFEQK